MQRPLWSLLIQAGLRLMCLGIGSLLALHKPIACSGRKAHAHSIPNLTQGNSICSHQAAHLGRLLCTLITQPHSGRPMHTKQTAQLREAACILNTQLSRESVCLHQEDSWTHSEAAQHRIGPWLGSGLKVPLSVDKDLSLSSRDSLLESKILCCFVPRGE